MAKSIRSNAIDPVSAVLPSGVLLGLAVYFSQFAFSLLWNGGFSVMGVSKGEVANLVISSFWPWVLLAQLKIMIVYLIIGYAIGLTAELVAENLFPMFRGVRLAWIFAVNACLLIFSIKKYPQLYTESLYDRGGFFKFIQIVITDQLPVFLLDATCVVLLSFFIFALGIYLARKFREQIYLAAFFVLLVFCFAAYKYIPKILPSRNSGPNIIVLAADSLRADRLGGRQYNRLLTPNIDKLAQDGVTFDNAFTSFPRTFPAAISLLTGRFPVSHGVRHMFPDKYSRDHRRNSMVEILRSKGYATAVISDFAGDVFSRMKIGFDDIRAPYFNFITLIDQRCLEIHFLLMPYVSNQAGRMIFPEIKEFAGNADPFILADEAIAELTKLTRKDKFICFVFFSNIHFPYASPAPYYKKYADKEYNGRFKYQKPPTLYGEEIVTDKDIEQARALYDGSVEAFDKAAGKIIDYLKIRNCLDNTVVIVTADHGENLYENNWYIGHGEHLKGNNVLNVPLVIKFPGDKYKGKVSCLTRDVDVAPTLLEYLGLSLPQGIDGVSLMPAVKNEKIDLGLFAFAETGVWFSDISSGFFQKERIMYPDITAISEIDFTCGLEVVLKKELEPLINTAKHRMIDDGRYRLIYIPERKGVRYELYDRIADPRFVNDISVKEQRKLLELKKKLFELMSKDENIVFKKDFAVPER